MGTFNWFISSAYHSIKWKGYGEKVAIVHTGAAVFYKLYKIKLLQTISWILYVPYWVIAFSITVSTHWSWFQVHSIFDVEVPAYMAQHSFTQESGDEDRVRPMYYFFMGQYFELPSVIWHCYCQSGDRSGFFLRKISVPLTFKIRYNIKWTKMLWSCGGRKTTGGLVYSESSGQEAQLLVWRLILTNTSACVR